MAGSTKRLAGLISRCTWSGRAGGRPRAKRKRSVAWSGLVVVVGDGVIHIDMETGGFVDPCILGLSHSLGPVDVEGYLKAVFKKSRLQTVGGNRINATETTVDITLHNKLPRRNMKKAMSTQHPPGPGTRTNKNKFYETQTRPMGLP